MKLTLCGVWTENNQNHPIYMNNTTHELVCDMGDKGKYFLTNLMVDSSGLEDTEEESADDFTSMYPMYNATGLIYTVTHTIALHNDYTADIYDNDELSIIATVPFSMDIKVDSTYKE